MRKFVEFRFVFDDTVKTISAPAAAPFKFVLQFAAESFAITKRITSITNFEGISIDASLLSSEIWQMYGCDLTIRTNT